MCGGAALGRRQHTSELEACLIYIWIPEQSVLTSETLSQCTQAHTCFKQEQKENRKSSQEQSYFYRLKTPREMSLFIILIYSKNSQ